MTSDPELQPTITGFDSDLLTPQELESLAIPSTINLQRLFNPRPDTATVLPLLATICNLRRRLAELNGSPCGE